MQNEIPAYRKRGREWRHATRSSLLPIRLQRACYKFSNESWTHSIEQYKIQLTSKSNRDEVNLLNQIIQFASYSEDAVTLNEPFRLPSSRGEIQLRVQHKFELVGLPTTRHNITRNEAHHRVMRAQELSLESISCPKSDGQTSISAAFCHNPRGYVENESMSQGRGGSVPHDDTIGWHVK